MSEPNRAKNLRYELRLDGVAVLTFDTPGSSVNVLSKELLGEVEELLDVVETDPEVKAVVLASGKADTFIAGANLDQVLAMETAGEAAAFSRSGHDLLDRMERSGKPVVAAIHGAALGGGLEVAMACRYRLATDDPKTVLALPEVMLGLLPAGGGTQRLPRLVGLPAALPMLLTGRRLRARQALRYGLVDALTSPGGLAETAARAALGLANGTLAPSPRRRRLLERLAAVPPLRGIVLGKARDQVLRKTRGLYPAPLHILSCVEEGLSRGKEAGQERESALFGELVESPGSKNLIRLFDAMTALKKRPEGAEPRKVGRLAVLGAGLMGEGIAAVSLPLNPVVLKDVSEKSLARAAGSIHAGLEKRRRSGALTRLSRDRHWFGLLPTADPRDVAGCDLVVEAVFEDLALKRKVLAECEEVLSPSAVFASNTSALPIREIARDAKVPERVVGMHYFSPVPKMPLLEVIAPEKASAEAVATARAYGVAQGKTVIVVKDGPGFYTTRILAPMMNEAILLLDERADVASIEAALSDWGFPVGPITLLDEVGIDVAAHVAQDLGQAFASRGAAASPTLGKIAAAGFLGRKAGKGFYLYTKDKGRHGRKPLNPEMLPLIGGPGRRPFPVEEIVDRLALLMVSEAVRCLEEGILASPRDGDVGAILGLGFPPFRGGPFRHVDAAGADRVVARLGELAGKCGPRFAPPDLLVSMAREGKKFY